MIRHALEGLESRLLFATLPANFSETIVANLNTSVAATMTFAPDGRLFVGDTTNGQIRVVKNGALLTTPALTLNIDHYRERGINGIAFAPDFATAPADKKYVDVYYTKPGSPVNTAFNGAKNRVSRFAMSTSNPDQIDPASEVVLLDNIPSDAGNHNGGMLHFGADGMLYLGVGDNATGTNAQDLSVLNGKILRLNVSDPANIIPADNPFVSTPGARGEIFADGFRNPFTGNFKPGTNTLYVNDVGESTWEEIDDVQSGKNYGWPTAEGISNNPDFTSPIYEYNHNGMSAAITGGTFYTGANFPASYQGKYFFGDYILKKIWLFDPTTKTATVFADNTTMVDDFDVSPIDGSLWYLDLPGEVHKVTFTPPSPPPPPPSTITVRDVADAYVRDGSFAATNFGAAGELDVKKFNSGFNRESYLKFDLTKVSNVGSAKLRLFGKLSSTEAKNVAVNVLGVAGSTWGESTIDYANRPATTGTTLGSQTVLDTTARWYEFDVTSFIKANAGKFASLKIQAPANSLPVAIFNSDEAATNQPQLVISTKATTALHATQDTYVHDGATASTNFGNDTKLQIKKNTTGFNRETYLKFDLSSVSTINSAKLRLFGGLESAPGKSVHIAAYSVDPNSWTESTLTFANKPASGTTALATLTLSDATNGWKEWDLTSFIKSEKAAGHNVVSIVLRSLDSVNPIATFASDEAAANQPQLAIS